MRTITLKHLRELGACADGLEWFKSQTKKDAGHLLLKAVEEHHSDWANWYVVTQFTRLQAVQYAIFCATSALDRFETIFPDDSRPQKAIEAAKNWLINPCESAADAAQSAADAAHSAAESVAEAAEAAYAARSATQSAAKAMWSAADAAWSAASAARSAASAGFAKIAVQSAAWNAAHARHAAWLNNIKEAIRILAEND